MGKYKLKVMLRRPQLHGVKAEKLFRGNDSPEKKKYKENTKRTKKNLLSFALRKPLKHHYSGIAVTTLAYFQHIKTKWIPANNLYSNFKSTFDQNIPKL